MLQSSPKPLSPDELTKILQWITSPAANLVVRLMESKICDLDVEIAKYIPLAFGNEPGQMDTVKELAERRSRYDNFLEVLKEVKERSGNLAFHEITDGHEFANHFATIDAVRGSSRAHNPSKSASK